MGPTMRMLVADVTVDFAADRDDVYRYLTDPRHRPLWQASLRRVDGVMDLGTPGGVGSSWTDVTAVPFVSSAMEVVESTAGRRWREIGRWGPVDAALSLEFADHSAQSTCVQSTRAQSTKVRARAHLTVPVLAAPALYLVRSLAPAAVRGDLHKAASILDARALGARSSNIHHQEAS
ncbi:SRPBCC family protein [Gordonia sp. DT30]|uniref:SRPBCC family protein n=1 Tax=unclassified Gordonia (in: high G+C Gram-positive bacteria) TaxID=2657482 RepID=UPI003CEEF0E0